MDRAGSGFAPCKSAPSGTEAGASEQEIVGPVQHGLTQIMFLTLPSYRRNSSVNKVLCSQRDHGGTGRRQLALRQWHLVPAALRLKPGLTRPRKL